MKRRGLLGAFVCALTIAACAQSSNDRLLSEKSSPRLLSTMQSSDDIGRRFDVVVSLSDSSGVKNAVSSLNISSRSVATGSLTAEEIRKLAGLPQVIRIDISKTFFPNTSK